jgi:hypothetical protein
VRPEPTLDGSIGFLNCKHYNRLERYAMDKHFSLFDTTAILIKTLLIATLLKILINVALPIMKFTYNLFYFKMGFLLTVKSQ